MPEQLSIKFPPSGNPFISSFPLPYHLRLNVAITGRSCRQQEPFRPGARKYKLTAPYQRAGNNRADPGAA